MWSWLPYRNGWYCLDRERKGIGGCLYWPIDEDDNLATIGDAQTMCDVFNLRDYGRIDDEPKAL